MEAVLAEELDEEEQLVRRHRKEKKELQAKIQGLKNAVPKNDKQRRKQLTEDVAKLEAEMEQKHKEELEQLRLTSKEIQRRRDKKAALEKEREERIAEAETENLSGARHLESEKLAQILAARQLEIKQIPSDGHCMYRAIEDQLKEQKCPLTMAALRSQTAEYIKGHVEDFLPFLTNPNMGEMYTQEEFRKYCDDIINTAAWGGQLERRALSHILQTPIEIIQADSPPIVVGEEYKKKNPINTCIYETCIGLRRTLQFCYTVGEHSY
ncbi:deubiquitinase OTUD6B-like isoform X2 [Crocuta crocuta]